MWYPLNVHLNNRGIPINNHPGAFGNARKFNFHEGVDLYGSEGDWVYAMNSGVVTQVGGFTGPSVGCDWWLETDAVAIQSETEIFIYGELKTHLKLGDVVKQGDKIGELVPVLPKEKIRPYIPEHSNVMLHLEKYSLKGSPKFGWAEWQLREDRPLWLLDPTNDLVQALTKKFLPVKLLTL